MTLPHNQLPGSPAGAIKTLSSRSFLAYGVGHVVYIRMVAGTDDDEGPRWGVYAADGSLLDTYISAEDAVSAARADDLHPIQIH